MTRRLSVLIVESHWMLGDAFRDVLDWEQDLDVLPVASSTALAVEACAETCPDVVVIDVDEPDIDQTAVRGAISERCPEVRVILMSSFSRPVNISGHDALDVVSKQELADDLAGAIRKVASIR
jgi:two-component system response regulator DesR